MFKPFFVHRYHGPGHRPNRAPRGFTAFIQPDPENPRNVLMQATFCAPKDQYNKKSGREFAKQAKMESINKREIPKILSGLEYLCELTPTINESNWHHIYKYLM